MKANREYSIYEIKRAIDGENMFTFDELELISTDIDYDGDSQFVYYSELYEHTPSSKHLIVKTKRIDDNNHSFLSLIDVCEIEDKESINIAVSNFARDIIRIFGDDGDCRCHYSTLEENTLDCEIVVKRLIRDFLADIKKLNK